MMVRTLFFLGLDLDKLCISNGGGVNLMRNSRLQLDGNCND